MQLLTQLAGALGASITDLIGKPYAPHDWEHAEAQRAVMAVRLALLAPDGPDPTWCNAEDSLEEQVTASWLFSRNCDMVGQARLIPYLLRGLHQKVTTDPTPIVQKAFSLIAYDAAFLMRNLGEMDLAWIAATRMEQVSAELDDPRWRAMAAYTQAHSLYPVGAWAKAHEIAASAAETTPVKLGQIESAAARGSCLLVGSFAAACAGDLTSAQAQLHDAEEMATFMTDRSAVADRTSFSDWNVLMHRVAVEVEAGDPAAALAAADRINPAQVPNRERLSYLWVDVARAFTRLDRDRDAIGAFQKAERAAPLRVHLSPVVRESVRQLLDDTHSRATEVALRGLAERCDVLSA
ncbi:MAG: putative transcriptional regulator [Nocardia sp.]|nr:putative transcriptional regulator [Nocardia sp.]